MAKRKNPFTDCEFKRLAMELDDTSLKTIMAGIDDGVTDIIELPFDSTKILLKRSKDAKTPTDKRQNLALAKKEKKRYFEHLKLYKYLLDSSKRLLESVPVTVTPNQFIDERVNYIQSVIEGAYGQSVYKSRKKGIGRSGLNNIEDWDAGKIKYIRLKIEKWEKMGVSQIKKELGLTKFEQQMKAPGIVAASLDPTGSATKLVKMSQEVLDMYLMEGFKWKESVIDPTTGKKSEFNLRTITDELTSLITHGLVPGLNEKHTGLAIERFFDELMHTEARNIIPGQIPTTPKEFQAWRNSWKGKSFFKQLATESERHTIGEGGEQYVLIPLHQEEKPKAALKNVRDAQIDEGTLLKEEYPGENENAYLVYRIPDDVTTFLNDIRTNKGLTEKNLISHLKQNGLEEGFYTAQSDVPYPFDPIPGTMMPKRKWNDWTYGIQYEDTTYQPPKKWMVAMWDTLEKQREWSEAFFNQVLKKEYKDTMLDFGDHFNRVVDQLVEAGYSAEDLEAVLNKVDEIGGLEYNLREDSEGNFVGANSFIRKVSRWSWGHVKYEDIIYKGMLQEAISSIEKSHIPEMEAHLEDSKNILESEDADSGEKSEALEDISLIEERLAHYDEIVEHMKNRLYGDYNSEDGRRSMQLSDKIVAGKGRTLFADKKQRIKTRDVHNQYVDQAMRTIEYTRLKTQLLKTILAVHENPHLVQFLTDQTRASTGHIDVESQLLWFDTSDENVASYLSGNWDAQDVRDINLMWRGLKTGMNLGTWTSITNNFQRVSQLVNYGIEPWWNAVQALEHGDANHSAEELKQQIHETGVTEPFNAFIDMLTMGLAAGDTGAKDALLPFKDIAALVKSTTLRGWLTNSKGWDKMIASASERSSGEKIETQELRRIKTLLFDIVSGESKDKKLLRKQFSELRMGLTRRHINRLVKWKIDWFPLGILKPFVTMKGSEQQMREEATLSGFYKADELGRVKKPPAGRKWKYTDSPAAVRMGRLYVYYNLFGFTKPMLSKMFRGGTSGTYLQWKQYDWNEIILEHETLRGAALSGKYDGIGGWATLAPRMSLQLIKKMVRAPGLGSKRYQKLVKYLKLNKELDDKNLDRASNMMAIRGLASLMSVAMFYKTPAYGVWRMGVRLAKKFGFGNPITQRGVFGLASPLLTRTLHLIWLGMFALDMLNRDEEDEVVEDVLRDYFPGIVVTTWMLIADFYGNMYRGIQQYLPTPIKEAAGSAEEVYEILNDD